MKAPHWRESWHLYLQRATGEGHTGERDEEVLAAAVFTEK